MKTRFLFPYSWRKWGVVLFILRIVILIIHGTFDMHRVVMPHQHNPNLRELVRDMVLLTLICGLLLITFTKEKIEDEHIAQLRLDSLQWAVYFNYIGLIACILFISNWHTFVGIAAHFIFTPLLFFIVRFRWVVYQSGRVLEN